MGFSLEFNWYIVAKTKSQLEPTEQGTFRMTKEGRRLYPIGDSFPLPMIVEGRCLGLAFVEHLEIGEDTTMECRPVQLFSSGDALAIYYEQAYQTYQSKQEALDTGGTMDLAPQFMARLHALPMAAPSA